MTEEQVNDLLEAFAEAMGLQWLRSAQIVTGNLDVDVTKVKKIDEDLNLLYEHLGLKIEQGKRVVKVKRGKK